MSSKAFPSRFALFLDRDGVINEDLGYVHRVEDFHFREGIFDLCRTARSLGYLIVVVTNQSGIGRGMYTEADVSLLHSWMVEKFASQDIPVYGIYLCPHHPTDGFGSYRVDCDCRKPRPGLMLQASRELGIDLASSVMVGDKPSDVQAGRAAGVGLSILLDADREEIDGGRICRSVDEVKTALIAAARQRSPLSYPSSLSGSAGC